MYQDAQHIFTVSAPAITVVAAGSTGYDLNADFGNGQYPRRSPLIGAGEEFLVRVDVTQTFVAGGIGDPVFQFHLVIADTPTLPALNMITIGSAAPGSVAVAQTPDIQLGFHVSQLALGNYFFIRANPWSACLGRNAVGSTVIGKDLRYLGLLCVMPNYHVLDTFATGQVKGYLVSSSTAFAAKDHIYPSATKIVG